MPARKTTDPLDAIDWGTEVNHSNIRVYFAPGGFLFGERLYGWTAYEQRQAMLALEQYSNIADIDFRKAGKFDNADFVLTISNLRNHDGEMQPPGEQRAGWATFDDGVKLYDVPLDQGSYAFKVLLHEFGHGLGLAHPHDPGGASGILAGVRSETGSYGIGDLNQGVYTAMSYNDGWATGPGQGPQFSDFGFEGTPMALDIAVIQAKYGANLDHATGDDAYRLPGANRVGTFFSCIWDAGGDDRIVFGGPRNCTIDLRAATLLGEGGGGGQISHVRGIYGGFTIAHGVLIEDASGGSGDDTLRGNEVGNRLSGGAGADLLIGDRGNDALWGGAGADEIRGGKDDDRMSGGRGADLFVVESGGGDDRITDFAPGGDQIRIRSGAADFDDLTLHREGGDTYVEFADVTLRLDDLRLSNLNAESFIFG